MLTMPTDELFQECVEQARKVARLGQIDDLLDCDRLF